MWGVRWVGKKQEWRGVERPLEFEGVKLKFLSARSTLKRVECLFNFSRPRLSLSLAREREKFLPLQCCTRRGMRGSRKYIKRNTLIHQKVQSLRMYDQARTATAASAPAPLKYYYLLSAVAVENAGVLRYHLLLR